MSEIDIVIFKLISKETQSKEFEAWVYSEKSLESVISSDDYLELISLNYESPSALYEAKKILTNYIQLPDYYDWLLRETLQNVISRPLNACKYIEQCYDFYCDGFGFLRNLGLRYGLTVVVLPGKYIVEHWSELNTSEQQELLDSLYPGVAEEAEKIIGWMNAGKIILTRHSGEYQGIEYEDNRALEEKDDACVDDKPSKKWWQFW